MKRCRVCGKNKPIADYYRKQAMCKSCDKERNRQQYKDNRESKVEQNKRWRDANPGYSAKNNKQWDEANPGKNAERGRKYYKENIDEQRAKGREKFQRRAALKAALPATLTSYQWEHTLKHFNNCCAYCGEKLTNAHQDHFIPLSKGGEYTKRNIVPSCKKCNSSKSNKPPLAWLIKQGKLITYVKIIQFLERR